MKTMLALAPTPHAAPSAAAAGKAPRTVWLHQSEVSCMEVGASGLRLRVLQGAVWITQSGDPKDYVVEAGALFTASRVGKVVAESLTPRAQLAWSVGRE